MHQLRKYRIQLNELLLTRDANIQREKNIHKAELERIAIKTDEFKEECQNKSAELKSNQLILFEELNKNTQELEKVNKALGDLQDNKFKLRTEILLKIQAENQAKKNIKRNIGVFNKELQQLNDELQQEKMIINNYDTIRRQINEDFYNWRAEKEEITSKLTVLSCTDKKYKILADYLAELENDTRAQPDKRYTDLDQQIRDAEQKIFGLDYQISKIKRYMATFSESTEPQELIISTYLRDTKAKLPELKHQQSELLKTINVLKTQISELDDLIKNELTRDLPVELVEQTNRANMRIEIATARINSEYDPLIQGLRVQINVLETELSSAEDMSNNIVVSEKAGCEPSSNNNIIDKPDIDLSNMSRKEIERLKKQMAIKNT